MLQSQCILQDGKKKKLGEAKKPLKDSSQDVRNLFKYQNKEQESTSEMKSRIETPE